MRNTDMTKLTRRSVLQGTGAASMALSAGMFSRQVAAQEDDLYQAAKKEGHLTRYDGIFEQKTIEAILEAFNARYSGVEGELLTSAVANPLHTIAA